MPTIKMLADGILRETMDEGSGNLIKILKLNTSKVTNMSHSKCINQDRDWDTSEVTNMFAMFYAARGFNQDIGIHQK